MDRGAWRAVSHRGAEMDTTEATQHACVLVYSGSCLSVSEDVNGPSLRELLCGLGSPFSWRTAALLSQSRPSGAWLSSCGL